MINIKIINKNRYLLELNNKTIPNRLEETQRFIELMTDDEISGDEISDDETTGIPQCTLDRRLILFKNFSFFSPEKMHSGKKTNDFLKIVF